MLLPRRLALQAILLAWCGEPFPPYAYQLPWFEFPTSAGGGLRVVGDFSKERRLNLRPLLVLPAPGLTYEYLETLEALTISERRVAFCAWPPKARTVDELRPVAAAALSALEVDKVHVLSHGTAAATALALQAAAPSRVASLTLASPLFGLDDAEPNVRESLEAGLQPLLATAPSTKARACVDVELPLATGASATAAVRDSARPPLAEMLSSATSLPALLTRGTSDVSSRATADLLLQRLPRAQLAAFDGSGSMAHVDSRAAYNQRLLDFLDEVDGVTTRRAVMLPGSMAPGGSVLN